MSGDRVKRMAKARHEKGLLQRIFTDKLYLSLVGVVVVLAVTISYLFAAVLRAPLDKSPTNVSVEMNTAAGLFEGSQVTYRGVTVGKVIKIDVDNPGISARVRLEPGTQIPKETEVKVRSLSPVGEQYLDFQPSSAKGPYLVDGSVIPASATELPETLATVVTNLNKLLGQVDTDKLRTVLVALATGLQGTGPSLNTLISQSQLLLEDLDNLWPETDRLLTNGGKVLDIAPAKADTLRDLGKTSKELAAWLKDYNPELRKHLHNGPGHIQTLRGLVQDANELFPPWLDRAVQVSDFFMGYEPHFRVIMTTYGAGMGALGRAVKDGRVLVNNYLTEVPRCNYGTPRRTGRDARTPLNTNGHCDPNTPHTVRTAEHAPGPVR